MPVRSVSAPLVALATVLWGAAPLIAPVLAQGAPAAPPRPQAPAAAARPDDPLQKAVERLAGPFRLTSADGERRCDLLLSPQPSGAGFAVTLDRRACAAIVFAAQVGAWTPDASGSIRLLNEHGRTIAEFTEATGGSFEALREGDGVYFLGPPTALDAGAAAVDEVTGDWLLGRGAGPVCRWTLTDARAARGGYLVQVAPDCDESLTRFAPATWEMSGGNILVRGVADGPTIRFARQEDGTWARIPERGRPLLMTRP
ncbi:AprI/Inh family metalloprotease inhibitor [Xanthobacter sp. V4C-4]|uniref:protease inhibitor Inh/omp19 family protein n=1 Tax=Xanthobacter cornucopiae TaxID=3119924 RepID=UPI00372B3C0E